MMRVGFIADVHVGNHRGCGGKYEAGMNDRCRRVIAVLEQVMEDAKLLGCDCIVIAGDLFDTTRPSPQIVAATGHALSRRPCIPVHLLMGNHDRNSDHSDDHALGPLALAPNVTIWNEPSVLLGDGGAVVMAPFQSGPASEWLPGVLSKLPPIPKGHPDVALALHLGLHDAPVRKEAFWGASSDDAISVEQLHDLMVEHDIDYAMAGNWHGFKMWELFDTDSEHNRFQCQIGALVPTGWDNTGSSEFYGSLLVVDLGGHGDSKMPKPRRLAIPGPRFYNVKSENELLQLFAETPQDSRAHLFVRWLARPLDVSDAIHTLLREQSKGNIANFDVRVDGKSIQEHVAQAVGAAQSELTLVQALQRFVSEMDLPEGVSRDRVFNLAKEML